MNGVRQSASQPPAIASGKPAVPAGPGAPVVADLLAPPTGLTIAQQDIWKRLAPSALEQRTLVSSTVPGFRELCEQLALKEALAARIEKLGGAGAKKATGFLISYVKLAQRLDSTLARFKLTSLGKPADGGAAKPVSTSPWTHVAPGAQAVPGR